MRNALRARLLRQRMRPQTPDPGSAAPSVPPRQRWLRRLLRARLRMRNALRAQLRFRSSLWMQLIRGTRELKSS
ncbi:MAG: hypothetical protein AAFP90_05635, partial [Planctomycetota bacterium]